METLPNLEPQEGFCKIYVKLMANPPDALPPSPSYLLPTL